MYLDRNEYQDVDSLWTKIRDLAFYLDAEQIHHFSLMFLKLYGLCTGGKPPIWQKEIRTNQKVFGLNFNNPLGLAAGFDKNGECILAIQALGFGFIEVGTTTFLPQEGNPKPRLQRLAQDIALWNALGFNNRGAYFCAKNIEKTRAKYQVVIPVGVNIGKSQVATLKDACFDYMQSFLCVADVADYITINVSSPNTADLRTLQQHDYLKHLLHAVCTKNQQRQKPKPLLLKLSPDLDLEQANICVQLAIMFGLQGVIISNTTTNTNVLSHGAPDFVYEKGGISGLPLFNMSTHMLAQLHRQFSKEIIFIGVGGIVNGKTAHTKMLAGAHLLQAYSGFVYQGPNFVRHVLSYLIQTQQFR